MIEQTQSRRHSALYWTPAAPGEQHTDAALVAFMADSRIAQLALAIYAFNRAPVVTAAAKFGGALRVIADRDETRHNPGQAAALESLLAAGAAVKTNTHTGLMHLKLTIAWQRLTDGTMQPFKYALGSFNDTNAASTINDEVLMTVNDQALAADVAARFESMWADTSRFTVWAPSPQPVPPAPPSLPWPEF